MPFYQVKHSMKNDKTARLKITQIGNPSEKCQATDFIFFLNTTLHQDPNKIEITKF